jgi:outer membrane protein assembly factor BamB
VVDSQNRVYCNVDETLTVFDSDGNVLVATALAGPGAVALSSDEATIYVAEESVLGAYASSDGAAIWSYDTETGSPIHGEPVVAADGEICFGSWDTFVYCLDVNGTFLWKYETGGAIAPLAGPTLSADETAIYVGAGDPNEDTDGTLYALDRDGALLWSETVDQQRSSGVAAAPDGSLFVNGGGRSHHLNSDGDELWESNADLASNLLPAYASQGIVYNGTAEGLIVALDAASGDELWTYQTGENPDYDGTDIHDPQFGTLTSPIIDVNGNVYLGAIDGKMYALDLDGNLLWTYETGDSINENGPAIGPDGTLYFSSSDGTIYAIAD